LPKTETTTPPQQPAVINNINYDNIRQYENKIKAENDSSDNPQQKITPHNSQPTKSNGQPLSEAEQKVIEKLKLTDAKVRQHEQAHLAAAGGLAKGGASFSYQIGPDGKQYAVGGEVTIDTSILEDPKATSNKMHRVIAAAMAPADPSRQDYSIAASARRVIAQMSRETTTDDTTYTKPNTPPLPSSPTNSNQQKSTTNNTSSPEKPLNEI